MRLEQKVSEQLINQKKTLAVAESCSGGLLGHRLTNVSGSSNFFYGGILAYHNNVKTNLLKVHPKILSKYGAVSAEVATLMAKNVRTIFKTDFGISITGIAGPTGGTHAKPVGLTFVAISTPKEHLCLECQFRGSREQIKHQATSQALKILLEFLA
jgi:nicotinamide-nucleotide amidase